MKNYYTTTKLPPQLPPQLPPNFFLNNSKYFNIGGSNGSKISYTHIIREPYVNICLFKNLLPPLLPKPKNLEFAGFSDTRKGGSDFLDCIKPLNFSRSRNYYLKKRFSENVDFSGFFQVVVRLEGV